MSYSAIKTIQCDEKGNEIRVFNSALEASRAFGKSNPNWIRKAIKNGTKAFGFRWKYFGKELIIKKEGTPGKRREILAWIQGSNQYVSFPSISQASRELHIGISSIEDGLLTGGPRKGYLFRYANEKPKSKTSRYSRPLVAIDESGKIIKEYPSVSMAAKDLKVNPSAIYACLRSCNENYRCKGYRWRYKQNIEPK